MNNDLRSKAKAKVLVIDDEASITSWLSRALPRYGYPVAMASSGEDGLEKIKQEKFDLIVCDIKMPGQGGVSVLKDIRRLQPNIEVIMATGYATVDTAVDSMKLGAFDFIAKPYTVDQLCALFDAALAARQSKQNHQKQKRRARPWLLFLLLLLLLATFLMRMFLSSSDDIVLIMPTPVRSRPVPHVSYPVVKKIPEEISFKPNSLQPKAMVPNDFMGIPAPMKY